MGVHQRPLTATRCAHVYGDSLSHRGSSSTIRGRDRSSRADASAGPRRVSVAGGPLMYGYGWGGAIRLGVNWMVGTVAF